MITKNKIRIFVVHNENDFCLFSSFFFFLFNFVWSLLCRWNACELHPPNIQAKPIRIQLASVAGNIWHRITLSSFQNQYITVLLLNVEFPFWAPRRKCISSKNILLFHFGCKIIYFSFVQGSNLELRRFCFWSTTIMQFQNDDFRTDEILSLKKKEEKYGKKIIASHNRNNMKRQ